ncbi:hypothetical protein [Pseudomonas putida]|uniref:Uncharacterized protein n=1 Tax=Pseudomonas putida TaxID=303 RepID=A0A8I1EH21_PSEPU|nr:hypothetical protein [Pseudomonas putida]MBI6885078.1 hypothetical protein [Pseudomonas putida]
MKDTGVGTPSDIAKIFFGCGVSVFAGTAIIALVISDPSAAWKGVGVPVVSFFAILFDMLTELARAVGSIPLVGPTVFSGAALWGACVTYKLRKKGFTGDLYSVMKLFTRIVLAIAILLWVCRAIFDGKVLYIGSYVVFFYLFYRLMDLLSSRPLPR